jgi:hypothetical protein
MKIIPTTAHSLSFWLLIVSLFAIHSSRKAGTLTPRVPVEEFDAYVDNKAAGEEKGTKDFPYHSITKALQKVTGRSIKVLAGKDYVEAIRITLNLNARITPAEPGLWAKK